MIARGFKSVVWVAAVGSAALGCYMLSLRVATERAELARVEARIIAAKQEIRSLQTELGTRGRMSQLERWNAEVLALSAPASAQFLKDSFTLARLERSESTLDERTATVRMASAETTPAPAPPEARPEAGPKPKIVAAVAAAPAPVPPQAAAVHRASFTAETPAATAAPAPRRSPRLDAKLVDEIARAAKAEGGAD